MELSYKLESFEGPLDLLLHLIEKNKVSIYDIPIVLITEQYLAYVSNMETEELNIVSEFLVMAATLIDIKARMLLPAEVNEEGEEEDPRAELVARLLEYKMYKYMAVELQDMEVGAEKHLDGLTLARLQSIFESVMKRNADKVDPIRSKFGNIKREPVSLEMKIGSVMGYARSHRKFSFRQLLERQTDKLEVVVTFLAVLELMKIGKIYLTQEHTFDDMYIETLEPEGESGELDLEGLDDFEG